jgi:hypothetical protein
MSMIEHPLVKQAVEEAPCQHYGCKEMGFACYLPDPEYEPEYFCSEHAFDHGYCKMCGSFNGGIESFEFINGGYCDECMTEMELNDGIDDECDGDEFYDPAKDC